MSSESITGGLAPRNVSRHAVDRFRKRASLSASTVADAWNRGESLNINRTKIDGEEARYDDTYRTILVRKGTTIVTVLDAETAKPSVLEELERRGYDDE